MIVNKDWVHENKDSHSPANDVISSSPSIFSELSDEKDLVEEVRMSRMDENVQIKEIIP